MKKITALSFAVLFFASSALAVSENYEYFLDAQSIGGPTGNIETYSPKVVPKGTWSFGLHRFTGSANFGLFKNFEAGINSDLKKVTAYTAFDGENTKRKLDEFSFHSKYRLLREGEHPVDLSAGHRRETLYIVCGKLFERFETTSAQGGLLWDDGGIDQYFALTQSLLYQQAILEFMSGPGTLNAGLRFLLSPEMKLDLFLNDLTRMRNIFFDNFVFGLTIIFVP